MTRATAIRTVAVAGGGIAGLSAAIAFARSLPGTPVTLLQTSAEPGTLIDMVPTSWPTVSRFHAAIGLDEADLVRSGIATHHLGTIFEDWSRSGQPWVHAFGPYGKPAGGIPFDEIWYRADREGEALPYDRYSLGAGLARAAKFVHPARETGSLGSRFQYGLRLDPVRYRERLIEHAARSGIRFVAGELVGAERSARGIESAVLSDGSRVAADFFVDCSGPSARLLSRLDDSFEDWSQWMPFDRFLVESEESSNFPSTADQVRASADGWSIEWPLRTHKLRAALSIGGEGVPISRGRRLRPWIHNVLAIGDAATALDPLHGMNLDVTQQAILLALELLPGREFHHVETQEYNRRAEQLTRRVRDFVALHYLRSGRSTGVWNKLSYVEPPDSLARTLDQYEYRGRLPFHEEESVTRDSWTATLLGMGILPVHVDPQAAAVPLEAAVERMREHAREIEEVVAKLPSYADYLQRMGT
ncbi:MAG TPA: FAD-dependent oxidoreductase [Sphingomicrobium sp.]|nr:FAD-dependent oxidoreductase [Sphingomicrobium sp.]